MRRVTPKASWLLRLEGQRVCAGAEDRPERDQIQKVAEHFNRAGPEVACLQGRLDYFNPTTNWLSRCFTLDYAGCFRVILPGLARMGFAIPLGGTTLFFRRAALEELAPRLVALPIPARLPIRWQQSD